MVKVFFVRHGKDDDRYRGGWSGLDLIPEGMEQAKQLARYLKDNNIDYNITRIISSDLQRTMTTANFIASELGLKIQIESQLREINNGDLAGILNDVALEKYPKLFFSSLKMEEAYPNGESPNDFYIRIKTWFDDFCLKCCNINGNVLVVTHGGVIDVIYHLANKKEWSNKGHAIKVSCCSVNVLNMDTMEFEVVNKTDFLIP